MPDFQYLDFDLEIERAPNGYRVVITRSPAGNASADFVLPFSDIEIENVVLKLGGARRRMRRIDSAEMETAKQFGGKLFNAVFTGDVRGVYAASLNEVNARDQGLRLRLHLDETPELADLPWEFLYNPSLNRFLALSVKTPVVRYLSLPEQIRPLLIAPPLRVLVMISSPSDYAPLDVEREWTQLKRVLSEMETQGVITLERLERATMSELQRKLQEREYHVLHFIGHGGFEEQREDGVLILENDMGRGRRVSAQTLGTLLHDHNSLRLAVLNACEGARGARNDAFAGVAQSLVQQGIPAVIAMQFEISDDAAATFASGFYQALARGYPVDAALAEVRKTIFASDNEVEWGTPVLYLRSPDGKIFDVRAQAPAPIVAPIAAAAIVEHETPAPVAEPETPALVTEPETPAPAPESVAPVPEEARPASSPEAVRQLASAAPAAAPAGELIPKKYVLPIAALAVLALLLLGGAFASGVLPGLFGTPTPTEQADGAVSGCVPAVTQVVDITMGDNPVLAPGTNAEKIWQVTNSGNCAWSAATLEHLQGQGPEASTFEVPNAEPGENVNIVMRFVTPNEQGDYESIWRLQSGAGETLDGDLHLNFRVDGSAVSPPGPGGVTIEQRGTDNAEMVFVPESWFPMGYDEGNEDEQHVHQVHLGEYWIDRYEVTNAQYARCVSDGSCQEPQATNSNTRENYYGNSLYDQNPVLNVTWDDANNYCSWAGKRLPSEAEWELAARGTGAYLYPWGNEFNESRLNFGHQVGDTREVGAYPDGESPYGALDMAGNVWEWVQDWYDSNYYANSADEDPQGPDEGENRVLRGGSWTENAETVRTTIRHNDSPSAASEEIGFRCAQ